MGLKAAKVTHTHGGHGVLSAASRCERSASSSTKDAPGQRLLWIDVETLGRIDRLPGLRNHVLRRLGDTFSEGFLAYTRCGLRNAFGPYARDGTGAQKARKSRLVDEGLYARGAHGVGLVFIGRSGVSVSGAIGRASFGLWTKSPCAE